MLRRQVFFGVGTVLFAGCSGGGSDTDTTERPDTDTTERPDTDTTERPDTDTTERPDTDTTETATEPASPTPTGSPSAPVIQHYKALSANDFETAKAAIHSDSPRGELSDESIERAKKTNYTVETAEIFNAATDTPEVHAVVKAMNTDTGETNTLDFRIEVRKEDGEWKMFQIVE